MITFKYKDKQYTTNNLEKKLLKLGITKNDISIMGVKSSEKEELPENKEIRYFLHPNRNKTMCIISSGENPTALEWFKDVLWNGSTGIKWCTPDYLEKLILI